MTAGLVHVVDDDDPFRDSICALLTANGHAVLQYCNGVDFLDRLSLTAQGCILLDVNMPGLDGLAVIETLKQRQCRLPVIVITGAADVPMAVRAMKLGAVDFLEKPLQAGLLVSSLRAAMAQASAPDDDPALQEFRQRLLALTERERQILEGVVAGYPTKVIAFHLGISPRTVDVHRAHIGTKLNVSGLSNLVRMAMAAGVQASGPLPRPSAGGRTSG